MRMGFAAQIKTETPSPATCPEGARLREEKGAKLL